MTAPIDAEFGGRMPVAFFGHGSPTNVLEENTATKAWREMALRVGTPKAILCVSAHWCTKGTKVTAASTTNTIHDFGRGLPAPLFDVQYNPPGSPELAKRVQELLAPDNVELDHDWGLDHGAWSVLLKAYPNADIPVVQLSMDVSRSEQSHFELAQKLSPLREEGVLIAASGNIVHNLGVLKWDDKAYPYPWAESFNAYIKTCIDRNDMEGIFSFRERGEEARLSVPTEDHFWPLLYACGASDTSDTAHYYSDYVVFASLGMTSILFH